MRMSNSIQPRGQSLPSAGAVATGPSHEISGEIQQLDPVHHTLVLNIDVPKPRVGFLLADDAQILCGAESESFGDLRPGEHVTVRYTHEGARLAVQRIEVAPIVAIAKP
jgi:hypothetical protein